MVDYIRGYTPRPVRDALEKTYTINKETILERMYHKPLANRFCADFCTFVKTYIQEDYLYGIVYDSFQALFENLITHYPDYDRYRFNCVGSVAYHFRDILETVAADYQMDTENIIEKPIDGLVHYYAGAKPA